MSGMSGGMGDVSVSATVSFKQGSYQRGAVFIAAVTVLVTGFVLIFGIQALQRIQSAESHWALYSDDANEADHLLHDITVQMGYGGFIHNFKNYILRRDPVYLGRLSKNRLAVEVNLRALEKRTISDAEKTALAEIHAAFIRYDSAVDQARFAFERGLSSVEVDSLVKLDASKTLAAFATLERSFMARAKLAQAETEKALAAASSMVYLLLIVVPVVVVLGVMLVMFLRRIVIGNSRLQGVRDELATLLRQAPDAILQVGYNGSILHVNDQAVELFGHSRAAFLELSVEDLIPNQFRAAHPAIRNKAFSGMKSRPIGGGADLVACTKDGREVPVEISLSFTGEGEARVATAIVRDVTERIKANEALKAAHDALEQRVLERTAELEKRTVQLETEMAVRERAENQLVQSAKMATIGEMASGITHELNQPMNIMRMGVEAAQIRIQRGQSSIEQLSETLKKIEDQILRMSDIITHMRAYSRLDTEGQAPFDPVQAIEQGCKLFSAQLQGDDIQLSINLPASAANILGHANRLEQVILNLLSNARDAIQAHREKESSPNEGGISITLREDFDGENIIILVEDSGGGVPKNVLPHIFAPFVTTKESGRGTGLGLSISFGIVQGMKGTIDIINGVHGARFSLQFPMVGSEYEHVSDDTAKPQITSGSVPFARTGGVEKILVVDDEVGAAHSLSGFLQEMGYLVYTAYNGEEALLLYDSDPSDAVITDLRMPVMDGEALVASLRERSADVPIFVMTGQGAGDDLRHALKGVTDVWEKPLSLSEVAQRLQAL